MIKKSIFEKELVAGMQQELRKQASGEPPSLVKAGECLHAAMEILEEAGLQSKADRILKVMHKIATDMNVNNKPTREVLMRHGLTDKDIKEFKEGQAGAKAKMNIVLRRMGFGDAEIIRFIGKHNLIPEAELKVYDKFTRWINNPTKPDPSEPSMEGSEISMQSLPQLPEDEEEPQPGESLTFNSIASKHRKPKRPDKTPDWHTKNLTPEKMIANLKHHGTEFNMADMNDALDQELADALGVNDVDQLNVDDLMDADTTDADDDILEVSDQVGLEDFEDEVSK